MDQPSVRKTYKEKLQRVLWHCRTLYNTALEQRITLCKQRGVSLTRSQQDAELKDLRASMPDYAAIHRHILQDVRARLDTTLSGLLSARPAEREARHPRFHGHNRSHSFTYKEDGNGAHLDNGSLVLSKIGRIAVHWSRPIDGTVKTGTLSKEADGWYVCFSCAEVPVQPLPLIGRETGIDVGLTVLLITADGAVVDNPRHYRTAERAQEGAGARLWAQEGEQPPSQGRAGARQAASAGAPATGRLSP